MCGNCYVDFRKNFSVFLFCSGVFVWNSDFVFVCFCFVVIVKNLFVFKLSHTLAIDKRACSIFAIILSISVPCCVCLLLCDCNIAAAAADDDDEDVVCWL